MVRQQTKMDFIPAPYNFVPLSDKVFFPQWADYVSHDVPFKDSYSGIINCTLKTVSPTYIRNGGKWDQSDIQKNSEAQSFFKVGDKYMIPGSSLKGMLRNVLEIASFGKIGNKVDDVKYSMRDLSAKSDYLTHMKNHETKAGWLIQEYDDYKNKVVWKIIPCDYSMVSHDDLIEMCGRSNIKERQSAKDKYEDWLKTEELDLIIPLGDEEIEARLVFTGQSKKNIGKKFDKQNEYLFHSEEDDKSRFIPVDEHVGKDFEFIHSDEKGTPNEEWGYWKPQLRNGKKVPVFYQCNSNGSINSFGLANMYKLPYKHSIKETVLHTSIKQDSRQPDLSETIFGFSNDEKSLKGRVSCSHAVAIGKPRELNLVETVLNGPKASYYPNYIEQTQLKTKDEYLTYMHDDAEIRGWKRYPARLSGTTIISKPSEIKGRVNLKVATWFNPLDSATEFSFKIRVHNLLKAELGALLWTLTWGNRNECVHSIGMGKPFGFGQVKISVDSCDIMNNQGKSVTVEELQSGFIGEFQSTMDRALSVNWQDTEQLIQLLAMANPNTLSREEQVDLLQYQQITNRLGDNEFVAAKRKGNRLRLEPYLPKGKR